MQKNNAQIIDYLNKNKEKILSDEMIKQAYYKKFHMVKENGKIYIKKRKFTHYS